MRFEEQLVVVGHLGVDVGALVGAVTRLGFKAWDSATEKPAKPR